MTDFAALRGRMVERQIAARGIVEQRLLEALRGVPREMFVPDRFQAQAYEDSPLPIEAGQTISQPYIVALMIASAEVGEDDRVLEVGAGSGYAAAVMSKLVRHVCAIERHAELCKLAAGRLERLGCLNVTLRCDDGSQGWPEKAPFDAILVAASGPQVPHVLAHQLADEGCLVMPVGSEHAMQRLVKVRRHGERGFEQTDLGAVRFVPLIGAHGWRHEKEVPRES